MQFRLRVEFLGKIIFDGFFKSLNSSVKFSTYFDDDCDFYLNNIVTSRSYPVDSLREVLKNA